MVRVATCQFPVSADLRSNLRFVARQLRMAALQGADVAHFPEGALSGYAGVDFETFEGFDWGALRRGTERLQELAAGLIVDRYDKRFCAGADGRSGELARFSPGDHDTTWELKGVRCGALICHEYRYPELYRDYARQGVQLVFHSFHAGGASPERVADIGAGMGSDLRPLNPAATYTYPGIDGVTTGRLRRNRPGVLISTVDTDVELYDSTAAWRGRAMAGTRHSGTLVDDPRSQNRTTL